MKNLNQHKPVEFIEYSNDRCGLENVASYDSVRYEGPANGYKQRVMENAYSRLVGSLEGKRLLDVGCGTGRGLLRFARGAKLAIGTDASHDMLVWARRKGTGGPPCPLVRAYAQHLPFVNASFDVVTALNFLHLFSLETQREMIAEIKRVTRPGGVIVLEFDNALQGLLVGFYKRWFQDLEGSLPRELRFVVGDNCRIVSIYGAVFPIIWRLLYRFPKPSVALEKIAYAPPFNRLSARIYYKVINGV